MWWRAFYSVLLISPHFWRAGTPHQSSQAPATDTFHLLIHPPTTTLPRRTSYYQRNRNRKRKAESRHRQQHRRRPETRPHTIHEPVATGAQEEEHRAGSGDSLFKLLLLLRAGARCAIFIYSSSDCIDDANNRLTNEERRQCEWGKARPRPCWRRPSLERKLLLC